MRLLAITRSCWDNNNNTGNTLTNLFKDFDNLEIFNLYLRNDMPRDSICQHFFQITENQLAKSILNKGECGRLVNIVNDEKATIQERNEAKLNSIVHRMPFFFPWFVRELLWGLGKWKSRALDDFLNEANPDIIFMPVFPCWYTSKILTYVHSVCKKSKIVLYHADDDYSLQQFSLSPLFWIYRMNQRKWIRRITSISSLNYCISEEQVEEYSKSLNTNCELLQKGIDIELIPADYTEKDDGIIDFVYTGNLVCGRWKTLVAIGDAIRKINNGQKKARLNIYSASVLTSKMEKEFHFDESVIWRGPVPASDVERIQSDSDVLVHVESLSKFESLEVRLSFSTKIVDYLMRKKCILAVGNKEVASIRYFIKNKNACVIDDNKALFEGIDRIVNDSGYRKEMAENATESAKKMHDKRITQSIFMSIMHELCH